MSKRTGTQPTGTERFGVFYTNNVADVPRDLVPSVRRCLARVKPYVPTWLRSLHVMFVSTPDDGERSYVLLFEGDYPYGRATLKIYAQWLELDDERRYEAFAHEFGHALTEPLRHEFCEAVEVLAPADDAGKSAVRELLIRNIKRSQETVAEDIKFALLTAERRGSKGKVK